MLPMLPMIAFAALLSGFIAQALKVVFHYIKTRQVSLIRILDTGGMPSSHASLVTTLTIGIAQEAGIDSSLFSIALIFSMYVVFEAAGLRQEVGNQAKVLNELIDDLLVTHQLNTSRLRELIGHTWAEVTGGFIVGLITALLAFY